MSKQTLPSVNGIEKSANTNGVRPATACSARVNGTMSREQVEPTRQQSMTSVAETSTATNLRESSRQFMSTMLADEADFTSSVTQQSGTSVSFKDSVSSSKTGYPLKRSPGAVRVVEFTSQSKSYVSAYVSSASSSRTSMQTSASNENRQFASVSDTSVTIINGTDAKEVAARPVQSVGDISNPPLPTGYATKSFVQQRIERLYGPGALAQGFFSRMRQESSHELSETVPQTPEIPVCASPGNHALPVLRHLRPEFRAQLPLTSSNTTQSPRHMQRNIPVSFEPQNTPPVLQQQTSIESISDSQPAAPEVPVLIVETTALPSSSSGSCVTVVEVLTSPTFCKEASNVQQNLRSQDETALNHTAQNIVPQDKYKISQQSFETPDILAAGDEEKDGHYFLKVLRSEIQRLTKMVEAAENELTATPFLHEEAQGKLRAASGQARLLIKQKLQQFEGLCLKNISRSPDEVFPTTAQDLAGFWDMVKLQVDHVDRTFAEIDCLKSAGWVEKASDALGSVSTNTSSGARRRQSGRRTALNSSGNKVKNTSEDQKKGNDVTRKSRDELSQARKKMMEERRRVLRQQQPVKQESIEIFVPHENGK